MAPSWRELLELVSDNFASDFHLAPGLPPMLTINKKLVPTSLTPLSSDQVIKFFWPLLDKKDTVLLCKHGQLTTGLAVKGQAYVRLTIVRHSRGWQVSARIHPWLPPSPCQLGLSVDALNTKFSTLGRGLWVFGGEGRTTMISAVVDWLASQSQRPIWIISPFQERGYPGRTNIQFSQRIPSELPAGCLVVIEDLDLPRQIRTVERLVGRGVDLIVSYPGYEWETVVDEFADRLWGRADYPTPRFEGVFGRVGGFVYQRLIPTSGRPGLIGFHEYFLQRSSSIIDEYYHLRRSSAYMDVPPAQSFELGLARLIQAGQVEQNQALEYAEKNGLWVSGIQRYLEGQAH